MDEYVLKKDILNYLEKKSSIEISTNSVIGKDISRAIDALYCDIDNITPVNVLPLDWVKLHDKHPDTEGLYLVCDQYGECEVVKYLPDIKSWFTHKINGEIRYWIPIPEPPKDGEQNG